MAYEPGAYSEELRQEHKQGEHGQMEHGHPDCPVCVAIQNAIDDALDPACDGLMRFAVELEKVTEQHATHSPTNSPDGCLKCAAEAGQSLL